MVLADLLLLIYKSFHWAFYRFDFKQNFVCVWERQIKCCSAPVPYQNTSRVFARLLEQIFVARCLPCFVLFCLWKLRSESPNMMFMHCSSWRKKILFIPAALFYKESGSLLSAVMWQIKTSDFKYRQNIWGFGSSLRTAAIWKSDTTCPPSNRRKK